MSIERRIEKFDLSQFPNNSDSRAAIHFLLSNFAGDINFNSLNEAVFGEDTKPLDKEVTRKIHSLRNLVLDTLSSEREVITLSPVGPFGVDSLLTETNTLKVSHASGRNVDVVADPTIQLAVEAYRRRKKGDRLELLLGTFHRCFRLQRYTGENRDAYTSHFEMFGTLDSKKSSEGGKNFSIDKIADLIQFYVDVLGNFVDPSQIEISLGNIQIAGMLLAQTGFARSKKDRQELLDKFMDEKGLPTGRQEITVVDFNSIRDALKGSGLENAIRKLEVLSMLIKSRFPMIANKTVEFNRLNGLGNYADLVFTIYVPRVNDIVDGGTVNWVSSLTSNRREATVVSGMGTELFAKSLI